MRLTLTPAVTIHDWTSLVKTIWLYHSYSNLLPTVPFCWASVGWKGDLYCWSLPVRQEFTKDIGSLMYQETFAKRMDVLVHSLVPVQPSIQSSVWQMTAGWHYSLLVLPGLPHRCCLFFFPLHLYLSAAATESLSVWRGLMTICTVFYWTLKMCFLMTSLILLEVLQSFY